MEGARYQNSMVACCYFGRLQLRMKWTLHQFFLNNGSLHLRSKILCHVQHMINISPWIPPPICAPRPPAARQSFPRESCEATVLGAQRLLSERVTHILPLTDLRHLELSQRFDERGPSQSPPPNKVGSPPHVTPDAARAFGDGAVPRRSASGGGSRCWRTPSGGASWCLLCSGSTF